MDINELLKNACSLKASDIHIKVGSPPVFRIDGKLVPQSSLSIITPQVVLSTLHTIDAAETVNRIISVFPTHQQNQIRIQLASVLKGVISQRLVPKADMKGRVPAVEVLIATATAKSCILEPEKTMSIRDVIAQGKNLYGMQTFDQSLFDLLQAGLITYDEAMRQATNPSDFALKVKGIQSAGDVITESYKDVKTEKDKDSGEFQIERF